VRKIKFELGRCSQSPGKTSVSDALSPPRGYQQATTPSPPAKKHKAETTTLIKCEHAIHYRAWQVHGISKKMLHYEPQFPAVFDLLREWLVYVGSEEGEVLVFLAHKAAFDLRVMRNALPLPSQATGCFMTPSKLSRNIALTSPATRSESWRTR